MAALIYLDTHVVAWLYAGRVDLLGKKARRLLEQEKEILISPMVVLELEYLHEVDRLSVGGRIITTSLAMQIGLQVCRLPFTDVLDAATDQSWTRDPFDRLIVGHAAAARSPLVTKDKAIRRHYKPAQW
jgi:PIN domain nuclease of toxin-antitoxin system